MHCEWNIISIHSTFLSGTGVGVVLYRWLAGEANTGLSLWLLAVALLLMVIAYLAKRLAGVSAS